MPIYGRYLGRAVHGLCAALSLYVGVRSLPLLLVSVMLFDAPGSETMIAAWLLFVVMVTAPFVEMLLAVMLLILAVRAGNGRVRPRRLALGVYATFALYIGVTLATPMRQLIF